MPGFSLEPWTHGLQLSMASEEEAVAWPWNLILALSLQLTGLAAQRLRSEAQEPLEDSLLVLFSLNKSFV